jgi:Protein of unknown function (DUF3168)
MEDAVTLLLLNDPRLAQLVGNRVHWDVAPQGTARPYLILQVASADVDTTMEGRSGLETNRLQMDAYADSSPAAKNVARFAFEALEAARGARHGIHIQGVFLDSRRDLPAGGPAGTVQLFRRSTDILITWRS